MLIIDIKMVGGLMHYFLKQAVIQTSDVNVRREELHVHISADVKKRARMLIHSLAKQAQTKKKKVTNNIYLRYSLYV